MTTYLLDANILIRLWHEAPGVLDAIELATDTDYLRKMGSDPIPFYRLPRARVGLELRATHPAAGARVGALSARPANYLRAVFRGLTMVRAIGETDLFMGRKQGTDLFIRLLITNQTDDRRVVFED